MTTHETTRPNLPKVDITIGEDMTERRLFFTKPVNSRLMHEIVARMLSDDRSIRDVSDVQDVVDSDVSWISIHATDANDWTSPAIVKGEELQNGVYRTKQELVVDAARFALTALSAAEELGTVD